VEAGSGGLDLLVRNNSDSAYCDRRPAVSVDGRGDGVIPASKLQHPSAKTRRKGDGRRKAELGGEELARDRDRR
jgi:hypothetical protein